jgi:hypothetical protein
VRSVRELKRWQRLLSRRRGSLMARLAGICSTRLLVLVLAGLLIVYRSPSGALEKRAAPIPQPERGASGEPPKAEKPLSAKEKPLPVPVEEMRQAILAAALSGHIEELRVPLDWNEMKPDVTPNVNDDAIAFWKKTSGDGEGREVLAALANMLQMRPAAVPLGKDAENNLIYVWPYLAETKLDALTPPEEVDLLRLVSPEAAKSMRDKKKWTWWRLTIGADGTWHSFRKGE